MSHQAVPVQVANELFSVSMAPGPLTNDEGGQCMVRLDVDARQITVSSEVPSEFRAAVGAIAAARAWERAAALVPVIGSVD